MQVILRLNHPETDNLRQWQIMLAGEKDWRFMYKEDVYRVRISSWVYETRNIHTKKTIVGDYFDYNKGEWR